MAGISYEEARENARKHREFEQWKKDSITVLSQANSPLVFITSLRALMFTAELRHPTEFEASKKEWTIILSKFQAQTELMKL